MAFRYHAVGDIARGGRTSARTLADIGIVARRRCPLAGCHRLRARISSKHWFRAVCARCLGRGLRQVRQCGGGNGLKVEGDIRLVPRAGMLRRAAPGSGGENGRNSVR